MVGAGPKAADTGRSLPITDKALLEVLVAQNHHHWLRRRCGSGTGGRWRCWLGWLGRPIRILEISARSDCPTHHLKEIRRYCSHADLLKCAVYSRKSSTKRIDRSEILEIAPCAVAQVEKVGVGKRKIFDIPSPHVAAGQDQAVWVLVWKLPQQHTVSDTKDSGAGADSKCDGDDRCDGKYGTFAQRAKRVGEIV